MLHAHTLKQNAGAMADTIVSNASMAAQQLADEAQHTASRVGAQLTDWTEDRGQKLAALWSLGGSRARSMVLSRPLLSLTLVAGASALATYWYLKRRSESAAPQTSSASSNQNSQAQSRVEKRDVESQYSAPQSTTVPASTTVM